MPVLLMNPDGLTKTGALRCKQVAVAAGRRLVRVAGEIASDANGQLVAPGHLPGQVTQAYRDVGVGLGAPGAPFSDVVRLTCYVVDWTPETIHNVFAGIDRVTEELQAAPAPVSRIGVAALFESGVLLEIEAAAVVD